MNDFRRGTIGSAQPTTSKPVIPNFRRHADLPVEAPGDAPTPASNIRANKYGAYCVNCTNWVDEGEGRLEKVGGKWEVSHIPPCPEVNVSLPKAAPAQPAHQVNVVNGETLYDGVYTLEKDDGHRTFRLRTQGLDDDFMPGVQIIEHLTGPANDRDYSGFGHVKGGRLYVWKRHQDNALLVADATTFMADPQAALPVVQCYRCHRDLTVPASVHQGLGPECVKRGM